MKTSPTPDGENLFDVSLNEEINILDKERATAFHHSVEKSTLPAPRATKDNNTAVAFLKMMVWEPDEDNCINMKWVLRYLCVTIYMLLILRAYSLNVIKWWIDVSYAVYGDTRSPTGATIFLGIGSAIRMPKEDKINTQRSTESEMVGSDDALLGLLWTL